MGMSVNTSRIYMQTGVDNQEEMKKYQELQKAAKEKLGKSYTPEHDRICAILAKDPNATVEDVEKMYDISQKDILTDTIDHKLQTFQRALKSLPGYKNAKLNANDLNNLLGIYLTSRHCVLLGKTPQETFQYEAEEYLKSLNEPKNTKDERDKLAEQTKQTYNEPRTRGQVPQLVEATKLIGSQYQAAMNKSFIASRKFFG